MLTMESIQDQLIKVYRNNKSNLDVAIEIKSHNGALYTCFNVYKWEGEDIVNSLYIYFFPGAEETWQEELETCLAIMNGELDPFEEEKTND